MNSKRSRIRKDPYKKTVEEQHQDQMDIMHKVQMFKIVTQKINSKLVF